jgi:hypothetical protein
VKDEFTVKRFALFDQVSREALPMAVSLG